MARKPTITGLARELRGVKKDYERLHGAHLKRGDELEKAQRAAEDLAREVGGLKEGIAAREERERELEDKLAKQADIILRFADHCLEESGH